ncbi:L,D-transpeptidase catalytic domain [Succinivibrio dextrinosolvens]|nr:L,D-transpeptidase catalytic domain [Succinivibrio dextrinosolvens]
MVCVMRYVRFLSALALVSCIFSASAKNVHDIPDSLLARAVTSSIPYDAQFDYGKQGKSADFINSIYPDYQSSASVTSKPVNTTSLASKATNTETVTHSSSFTNKIVDRVIVNKRAHQMILMKDGQEVRKFWIALSDRPEGKKMFEGDRRTPEGTYILDYVKRRSSFYKAIHISYPNAQDIENARKYGRRPGGMIMVHGQPNSKREYHDSIQRTNWTNGCIALLNPDMDIFLSMVDEGTPITINP